MAGRRRTSWTWLYDLVTPVALAAAEATWVALLLAALVDEPHDPHVSVPWLGLALPAAVAVAAGSLSVRLGRRWYWQGLLLLPVAVVGMAVTAALFAEVTRGVPLADAAFAPWSVHGHAPAVTVGVGWAAAVLAWGRGLWLGVVAPPFAQVLRSAGLGAAAFVGVIAGRTDHHATAFGAATASTGWRLLLWFALVATVVALVRERDLEQRVFPHARARPGGVWFALLAAPMLAVALVALLVAVVAGTFVPTVARGVAAGGRGIWRLIRDLLSLFHGHSAPSPSTRSAPHRSHLPPASTSILNGHTVSVPAVVVEVIALVVAAVIVALFIRYVRPFGRSRRSPDEVTADVETDSVFSWSHLWSQLGESLRGLAARLRRRRGDPQLDRADRGPTTERATGPEDVRSAYRRVLAVARSRGSPRGAAETTREYQARISAGPAATEVGRLGQLTVLYDGVRYGERVAAEADRLRAVECADLVADALRTPAPAEEPSRSSAGPPDPTGRPRAVPSSGRTHRTGRGRPARPPG